MGRDWDPLRKKIEHCPVEVGNIDINACGLKIYVRELLESSFLSYKVTLEPYFKVKIYFISTITLPVCRVFENGTIRSDGSLCRRIVFGFNDLNKDCEILNCVIQYDSRKYSLNAVIVSFVRLFYQLLLHPEHDYMYYMYVVTTEIIRTYLISK